MNRAQVAVRATSDVRYITSEEWRAPGGECDRQAHALSFMKGIEDHKMSKSDRRTFFKKVGKGTLAAGLGLKLSGMSLPEAHAEEKTDGGLNWPYPVAYEKENEIEADVLIVGGGVAGSHAAINAAKRGAKVVVVEKGATIRSGCSGAGVDHWHGAFTNPASKITPEEMMELMKKLDYKYYFLEYGNAISSYILFKESYDALLDVEKMGIKVRDVDDEFKGSVFRDEKTKLLFCYDYENKFTIRINKGAHMKLALYKEMKRLGVQFCDRVMVTSLLTEGGVQGGRVIGATGLNNRTGEFYIFKSKATIISTGGPEGLWVFSTELGGASTHACPNDSGDGVSLGWKAGAELALMERFPAPGSGGFAYPDYGTADCHNTWFACTIVDANGKEIPWVDRDGKVLTTVAERYQHAPGQKLFFQGAGKYEIESASLIPDLAARIQKGEYVLPLYADLPSMPADERRAMWGLMIYNETKTRIIYEMYQQAGFDPDKDLLQAPVFPADRMGGGTWWMGMGPRQWRGGFVGGGLIFDWDLKTSLDGLYVAGEAGYSGADHASSAATGRYAARHAAAYAKTVQQLPVSRAQIDKEKTRVYAPVTRTEGIGWKEYKAGVCRIMQDYCGDSKNAEILNLGLKWLASIQESEGSRLMARNPHELARAVECMSRVTTSEVIFHACLSRKASSKQLGFTRSDYPQMDPEEWNKLVTIKSEKGEVKVGELALDYYLKSPNADSFEENYRKHSKV